MKTIVIDANIIVALFAPSAYSDQALQKTIEWEKDAPDYYAPDLFMYEYLSAIRRLSKTGSLKGRELYEAVDYVDRFDINLIPFSKDLQIRSLFWAEKIGQSKIYDAAYLAAAESIRGEFWTADQRLVNAVYQIGVFWVHSILE